MIPSPTRLRPARPLDSAAQSASEDRPTASPPPSLQETARAGTSSQTAETPPAGPNSFDPSAIFLLYPHFPRQSWIGEFFRGSLELAVRTPFRAGGLKFVPPGRLFLSPLR